MTNKGASNAAPVPAVPAGNNDADNANRVTYDEFAILVRRIDRMEYSIGNIVSRVSDEEQRREDLSFHRQFSDRYGFNQIGNAGESEDQTS